MEAFRKEGNRGETVFSMRSQWEEAEILRRYIQHAGSMENESRSRKPKWRQPCRLNTEKSSIIHCPVFLKARQSLCPLWKVNGANDLLVRWCWENLRPLDIVNDTGLRDFVHFLEPGYQLPSRTYVAKQLKLRHQEGIDLLKEVLWARARSGVGLTSDIWTSQVTEAFNTHNYCPLHQSRMANDVLCLEYCPVRRPSL